MKTPIFRFIIALIYSVLIFGCSVNIINRPGNNDNGDIQGIPWVETRPYDVYVFIGVGDDNTDAKQLSYSRLDLLDKVNNIIIDENRPKWETNYKAGPFSSGTLEIDFHEAGNLKKISTTNKTGASKIIESGKAVIEVPESIEKKELEKLKREKEKLEYEKAISDLK